MYLHILLEFYSQIMNDPAYIALLQNATVAG